MNHPNVKVVGGISLLVVAVCLVVCSLICTRTRGVINQPPGATVGLPDQSRAMNGSRANHHGAAADAASDSERVSPLAMSPDYGGPPIQLQAVGADGILTTLAVERANLSNEQRFAVQRIIRKRSHQIVEKMAARAVYDEAASDPGQKKYVFHVPADQEGLGAFWAEMETSLRMEVGENAAWKLIDLIKGNPRYGAFGRYDVDVVYTGIRPSPNGGVGDPSVTWVYTDPLRRDVVKRCSGAVSRFERDMGNFLDIVGDRVPDS